ncbi:MAG: tyrosine-type recombinase/integrase [Planctomycetota bacterium]
MSHVGVKPIVFNTRAMVILDRYRRPLCPGDWIFSAPKDPTRPLAINTVAQRLRRARVKFTLYDCRRIAARRLRADGDLDIAQAMLGHARSSATEIYAPADHAAQIDAAELLDREIGKVLP